MASNCAYICDFCKKSFLLRGYKCKKCYSSYCIQCMSYLQGCVCESKVKQTYINHKHSQTSYITRNKSVRQSTLASLAEIKKPLSPSQMATSKGEQSISSLASEKQQEKPINFEYKLQELTYEINAIKGSMSSLNQINANMLANITNLNNKVGQLELTCNNKEPAEPKQLDRTEHQLQLLKSNILEECSYKMCSYAAQIQEFINYQHIYITSQIKHSLFKLPTYQFNNVCASCNDTGVYNMCNQCKSFACSSCKAECPLCQQKMCKKCSINCGHCSHNICNKCSTTCYRCGLSSCKPSACKQLIFVDCENAIYRALATAFVNSNDIYTYMKAVNQQNSFSITEYISQRRADFPYVNLNNFSGANSNNLKASSIINAMLLGKDMKESCYYEINKLNQILLECREYEKLAVSPTIIQKLGHCEVCNKEYFCVKPKYLLKKVVMSGLLDGERECSIRTKHHCECNGAIVVSKKCLLYAGNTIVSECLTDSSVSVAYTLCYSKMEHTYNLLAAITLSGDFECIIRMGNGMFATIGNKCMSLREDISIPLNTNVLLVYINKNIANN